MTTESPMGQFMDGFVAAAQLLRRAAENGFFIEYICLAASVIDGSLRIGLILRHQLKTQSSDLLDELLLQMDADAIVSEWEIDRRAASWPACSKSRIQNATASFIGSVISELTTHEGSFRLQPSLNRCSHGGFFGLGLLRDQPDTIHPNQRSDPHSRALALLTSTWIVLEQVRGRERDGALSIIRVVDRLFVTASGREAPAKLPPGSTVTVQGVLMFKSGLAKGSFEARIHIKSAVPAGCSDPIHSE